MRFVGLGASRTNGSCLNRNAPDPFRMASLNTTNIGSIERGLVVMGFVVDAITGVSPSIKRGHRERGQAPP